MRGSRLVAVAVITVLFVLCASFSCNDVVRNSLRGEFPSGSVPEGETQEVYGDGDDVLTQNDGPERQSDGERPDDGLDHAEDRTEETQGGELTEGETQGGEPEGGETEAPKTIELPEMYSLYGNWFVSDNNGGVVFKCPVCGITIESGNRHSAECPFHTDLESEDPLLFEVADAFGGVPMGFMKSEGAAAVTFRFDVYGITEEGLSCGIAKLMELEIIYYNDSRNGFTEICVSAERKGVLYSFEIKLTREDGGNYAAFAVTALK